MKTITDYLNEQIFNEDLKDETIGKEKLTWHVLKKTGYVKYQDGSYHNPLLNFVLKYKEDYYYNKCFVVSLYDYKTHEHKQYKVEYVKDLKLIEDYFKAVRNANNFNTIEKLNKDILHYLENKIYMEKK